MVESCFTLPLIVVVDFVPSPTCGTLVYPIVILLLLVLIRLFILNMLRFLAVMSPSTSIFLKEPVLELVMFPVALIFHLALILPVTLMFPVAVMSPWARMFFLDSKFPSVSIRKVTSVRPLENLKSLVYVILPPCRFVSNISASPNLPVWTAISLK